MVGVSATQPWLFKKYTTLTNGKLHIRLGPLFWAYEYTQPRMVSLLSIKGADTNAKDKHGM